MIIISLIDLMLTRKEKKRRKGCSWFISFFFFVITI